MRASPAPEQKLSPVHALRILAFHSKKPDLLLERKEERKEFIKMLLTSILDDEILRIDEKKRPNFRINHNPARLMALAGDALRFNEKILIAQLSANIVDTVIALSPESIQANLIQQTGGVPVYSFAVSELPSLAGEKPLELFMRIQFADSHQKNAKILALADAVVFDVLSAAHAPVKGEIQKFLTMQTIELLGQNLPQILNSLSKKIDEIVRASLPKAV